jgi:16S rRNA (guanine966-N2)-methyltransferase
MPRGNPELRPILDRIKTALFNILGPGFPYRTVLDLFAGSGSLGFEAASRGAELVVMVEMDGETADTLNRNAAEIKLAEKVRIERQEALSFLTADTGQYDIVFLDPPFVWMEQGRIPELVQRSLPRLAPRGIIVLRIPAEAAKGFSCAGSIDDVREYGKSAVLFISRGEKASDGR